jgi:hypothetical protein
VIFENFDFKPLLGVTVLLSLFVWLIKWLGRTLREVSGSEPRAKRSKNESTEDRLAKLFETSGAAAYIAAQNAAPGTGDARIAEHERATRAQEASLRAAAHAPIAPGSTAALPHAGRMTGVAVLVHCPMCGEPVNEVPTPLPFAVECPGCHRRINARGDGPRRMSIVVSEPRAER